MIFGRNQGLSLGLCKWFFHRRLELIKSFLHYLHTLFQLSFTDELIFLLTIKCPSELDYAWQKLDTLVVRNADWMLFDFHFVCTAMIWSVPVNAIGASLLSHLFVFAL